jgi:hypothetical protein
MQTDTEHMLIYSGILMGQVRTIVVCGVVGVHGSAWGNSSPSGSGGLLASGGQSRGSKL